MLAFFIALIVFIRSNLKLTVFVDLLIHRYRMPISIVWVGARRSALSEARGARGFGGGRGGKEQKKGGKHVNWTTHSELGARLLLRMPPARFLLAQRIMADAPCQPELDRGRAPARSTRHLERSSVALAFEHCAHLLPQF